MVLSLPPAGQFVGPNMIQETWPNRLLKGRVLMKPKKNANSFHLPQKWNRRMRIASQWRRNQCVCQEKGYDPRTGKTTTLTDGHTAVSVCVFFCAIFDSPSARMPTDTVLWLSNARAPHQTASDARMKENCVSEISVSAMDETRCLCRAHATAE